MKAFMIAALVAASLATPAQAFVIEDSPGGFVDEFAIAAQTREPIEIVGRCASACTMLLGARHVCVTPESSFGFHAAFTDLRDPVRTRSEKGTRKLMSFYPKPLRRLIAKRGGLTSQLMWLSGANLIALGVKQCPNV
jgi:hypothetical protein